ARDKFPCPSNRSVISDGAGGFWMLAGCQNGASVLMRSTPDGSVKAYGLAEGIKPDISSVFRDRTGQLWLATRDGLCRWTPGYPPECLKTQALDQATIIDDCEGRLVVIDAVRRQTFRLADDHLEPLAPPVPDAALWHTGALRDRDGNIWIGTNGEGLLRIVNGRVDRYTTKEGLSSNSVYLLLEDREGNIWAGTAPGNGPVSAPKVLRPSPDDGPRARSIQGRFGGGGRVVVGPRAD